MPRKSSRRTLLKGIGAAGIGGFLAGCTQTGGDGGDGGDGGTATMTETETTTEMDGGDGETATMTETETMTETPSNEDFNVGMVYALGGLGDKSFNDMANRGVRQAESELGISFRNAQPGSPSEFKTFQRRFATSTSPSYELICCIGFLQKEALVANSENYSDQKFMIVDNVVGSSNVASYVFKEHEGSFQVGHLAGLLTTMDLGAEAGQTNTDATNVGFVGGVEAPLIKKFQAGYEAGVKHANSDVRRLDVDVGGPGRRQGSGAVDVPERGRHRLPRRGRHRRRGLPGRPGTGPVRHRRRRRPVEKRTQVQRRHPREHGQAGRHRRVQLHREHRQR
jgi:basic membrane protein A